MVEAPNPASETLTATPDVLRLENQVCFPLYAATNLLQRLYRPLLAPLGLTYSQYLVMLVLWERGEALVGDLQRCLHLDTGTVTPLLKRMEAAGLVERVRDREDERRVRVRPTARGLGLRDQAAEVPAKLVSQVAMSEADGLRLRGLSRELVETLSAALAA